MLIAEKLIADLKESETKIDEEIERCKGIMEQATKRIMECEISAYELSKLIDYIEKAERIGY